MVSAQIQSIIRTALAEDIGPGDVTTRATVPPDQKGRARAVAKEHFIVAGVEVFAAVFKAVDKKTRVCIRVEDGRRASKGEVIAEVEGKLAAILQAERVALNVFQRMCGIATLTSKYVQAVCGTPVKILDTRKTAPGLRVLDKMAVRLGGGTNHRIGLYDAVLIKDNHIEAAGGIAAAVAAQRRASKRPFKIEVETKTLKEVREALQCGVDMIMLDNMTNAAMKKAVDLIDGRALTEASGNVNLKRVASIAATGVDFISVGELTHSVRAADISLKVEGRGLKANG
ncbi:MAG TPA: carboxylating nicotinate-nucleotide diphosphorylase [Smithellaceae bacterium]|nr:carboxylating nicotinate-nucleotide diphosphorylase [Smithellaceae bacterium]